MPPPVLTDLTAPSFPRTLLALSDSQLEIVMAAAHPLRPDARSRFLAAVAARLAGAGELGDGAVSRACRELQRAYFDPPIETSPRAGLGKYG
jgi:hypothetical protein